MSSLLATNISLSATLDAAKYIVRISPWIGDVRVGSFVNAILSFLNAFSASFVYQIGDVRVGSYVNAILSFLNDAKSFLSSIFFNALYNGSVFFSDLDKKSPNATNLPFNACTSFTVLGELISNSDSTFSWGRPYSFLCNDMS